MKYYSIGVPIGALCEGNARYFYYEEQLLSMNAVSFRIWTAYMHGAEVDSISLPHRLEESVDSAQRKALYNALVEAKLLASKRDLLTHYPQRQGYGVGFNSKTNTCVVMLNESVHVSYPAFLFWSFCDGRTSCSDIVAKIQKDAKVQFAEGHAYSAIEELLRNSLIVFVA